MKKYNIYYYHPLELSFKSAQTLQVLKDYYFLSKEGYEVNLYGEYNDYKDFLDIKKFIENSSVILYAKKNTKLNRLFNKIKFLLQIISDKEEKIIVTRHYRKLQEISYIKFFFNRYKIFHEMHEESFPYLIKKNFPKSKIEDIFKNIDHFIFTNDSQVELYKQEFKQKPLNYIVLYNGVELEKFKNAKYENNFVLTYLGQFNPWKNVELIFGAFSLLDARYTLKIAGGKGDDKSKEFILSMLKKYHIDQKRVQYLGFIKNEEIVDKVLNKSNLLLLPLGDNIQSKYLTSPMKLFEYMATSIPIVAVDYPTISSIIKNDEIYLAQNEMKDFATKIMQGCSESPLEKTRKMNQLALGFTYQNRSKKYSNYLQRI